MHACRVSLQPLARVSFRKCKEYFARFCLRLINADVSLRYFVFVERRPLRAWYIDKKNFSSRPSLIELKIDA